MKVIKANTTTPENKSARICAKDLRKSAQKICENQREKIPEDAADESH
jgi:hypothetical protein